MRPSERRGSRKRALTRRSVEDLHSQVGRTIAFETHDDAARVLRQGADLVGVGRAAIGNPTWAADVIAQPRLYRPLLPPFTEDDLRRRCGLSAVFVYYMRRWSFVKGADGAVLPFDPHNWDGVAR